MRMIVSISYLRANCVEEFGTAGVIYQLPSLLSTFFQSQSADLGQAHSSLIGSATELIPKPQHFLWRFGAADLIVKRGAFESKVAFLLLGQAVSVAQASCCHQGTRLGLGAQQLGRLGCSGLNEGGNRGTSTGAGQYPGQAAQLPHYQLCNQASLDNTRQLTILQVTLSL